MASPYHLETAGSHVDLLNENDGAVIENPLGHLNEEQLLRDVEAFAKRMSLTDILPGLRRAALVAQNIMIYDEVAHGLRSGDNLPVQLSQEEKLALKNERDTLFAQSRGFYMTILTVSLAGILQGQVQSSINGATLFFPAVYGLDDHTSYDEWIIGVTNSAPFIFAAVLGCPLVYPLSRRVGRRGVIVIAAILIFASSLGSAFCNTWRQLFAARIFNGIGMGLKACSTPILASETSVSFWRGSAALCWQLWVAFGIMTGFVINIILHQAGDELGMRLQLGAPMVLALFLVISIRWCPESPRWHMINGDPDNYRKAYRLFIRLRNTEIQAQRDLYLVHKQIELEGYARHSYSLESGGRGLKSRSILAQIADYVARFTQLFSSKQNRLRNALLAACTVNLAQQLCGINVLAFYSGTLFSRAGDSSNAPAGGNTDKTAALLYSFGFGAVNFFFGIPAIRNVDTLGRRTMLLATLPLMSICLLAAGLCFYIPSDQTAHIGLIAFFLFLFAALYSPGLGPMPFTVASESFPLSHREIGVALSVGVNLFVAGLLTVFYPRLSSALGDTGSLGLFAGLNVVAAIMIFLLLPETKQRTLEELDLVFAVPLRKFARYQIVEYLPWVVGHLWGRNKPLRDLYEDRIWKRTEVEGEEVAGEVISSGEGAQPVMREIEMPMGTRDHDRRLKMASENVDEERRRNEAEVDGASLSSEGTHD